MSDDDAAPESEPESESSADERPRGRGRRRSVIPEIVRRAVEIGVEKAQGAPDNVKQFVGDMKLPKEIAQVVFSQIDETKNGLFRVVAKEIRDFLEQTNFSGELQKLLTTVQFEVNTTIRFTPNDGKVDKDKKKKKVKITKAAPESAPRRVDDADDDPLDDPVEGDAADDDEDAFEEAPLMPPESERDVTPTEAATHRRRRER